MTLEMVPAIELLIDEIAKRAAKDSVCIVGIDGCGGAGKSTIALRLAAAVDACIVQMDDFYWPSRDRPRDVATTYGEEFDWRRLRDQVLKPLSTGAAASYVKYDWDQDCLRPELVEVPAVGVVIVEGVYSTRIELADFYTVRIWVDCPDDVRLARGLARDGDGARDRWMNVWIPQETRYARSERPDLRAHFRINGNDLL